MFPYRVPDGRAVLAGDDTVVDDPPGFNCILSASRQRFSFRILARQAKLARPIAWYSR